MSFDGNIIFLRVNVLLTNKTVCLLNVKFLKMYDNQERSL